MDEEYEMRTILLTLALIGSVPRVTTGQEAKLDSPPTILDLGSNVSDGSITAACTGSAPYASLSCTVYRLWVDRPSPESQQRSRDELRKDLDAKSDSDIKKGILEGKDKMKAVKDVDAKNADDIVAYLRTLAKK